jgi:hypothetical protein
MKSRPASDPPPTRILLQGLTTLQRLELQEELGSDVIQLSQNVPGGGMKALSNDTVVVLILTYPIAKAIAQVIVRDKIKITFFSRRSDGTVEEGTLTATRAAPGDPSSEDDIVRKLLGSDGTDQGTPSA